MPPQRTRFLFRAPPILAAVLAAAAARAQETDPENGDASEPKQSEIQRPEATDDPSRQLIDNYLTVTGGREAHAAIPAVEARGDLREGRRRRTFRLVETRSGQRRLTLTWREKGRDHKRIRATDGEMVWERQVAPEKKPARRLSGAEAQHFRHQFWLLNPFAGARAEGYVFDYRGKARALGRRAHMVVGYGPENVRTWFYFDREEFLLLRHGGLGRVAGGTQNLDYAAHRFTRVQGALFPKALKLLVDEDTFGEIAFESIEARPEPDSGRFAMPPSEVPVLRQKQPER